MTPTMGTMDPVDERFASGLGTGPWGLEFDPLTKDFFLGTWNGTPTNSIIQIGGRGFSATGAATTTTTTPASTTTSTTVPGGCDHSRSLADVNCRIDQLLAEVDGAGLQAKIAKALRRALTKAKAKKDKAEAKLAAGKARSAGKLLKAARKR
jgi:hypothetical protein